MLQTAQSLPQTFPSDTASLIPGHLAASRTGLTPTSEDEHTTKDHLHTVASGLLGARKPEVSGHYQP